MSLSDEKPPPVGDVQNSPHDAGTEAHNLSADKGVLEHHEHHNHKKHDPNWDGSGVDFSHINEAKVLRKMDLRLIPMLAVLYLLSFLDRGYVPD